MRCSRSSFWPPARRNFFEIYRRRSVPLLQVVVEPRLQLLEDQEAKSQRDEGDQEQVPNDGRRRVSSFKKHVPHAKHERGDGVEAIYLLETLRNDLEGIDDRNEPKEQGIDRLDHVTHIADKNVECGAGQGHSTDENNLQEPH